MSNINDLKIVFMGTPEFASTILEHILNANMNVVGVVTVADKPSGRGLQMNESAVKKLAKLHDLPVLQPTNLKDETFINELANLNADLFIVVAFRMLPEIVWTMPKYGTINLHASLLPQYRGAAPINWAIINGEKETGVTTFFIEKEIDTGNIIEQKKINIEPDESVGELHDKLMILGAQTVLSTIQKITNQNIQSIKQSDIKVDVLKTAHKIFKQDCIINWNQNAQKVHDFIRGLSPYPAAWCELFNAETQETKTFKIFKGALTNELASHDLHLLNSKNGILFPCGDYYYAVQEIQPEGKRRMNFKEFAAGNNPEKWVIKQHSF